LFSLLAHIETNSAGVSTALSQLGDLVQFPKTQGAFYVLMKRPRLKGGPYLDHVETIPAPDLESPMRSRDSAFSLECER
jgi:hypothetical protein